MIARLLAMAAALLAALSVTARAQDLLIQNVRLIDLSAESPQLSAPQSVLIRGDRIAAIAPVGAIPVPEGVTPIDGNGGCLLPGLTDMHVHVWDQASLGAYLAHGVTTIRNASGMPFHLDLARRINAG